MRLRSILILLAILLALGGYFYFAIAPPQPPPKVEPRVFLWDIEMGEIEHIEIRLPREGKSEAFIRIKEDGKFPWHFDDPQKSEVYVARWGGGIELLLTGPGAERVIARDATEEKLARFGLTQPQMEITLTLECGDILDITVGDRTPDGRFLYVQVPGTNHVALVAKEWYEVLARLVREPPSAPPSVD